MGKSRQGFHNHSPLSTGPVRDPGEGGFENVPHASNAVGIALPDLPTAPPTSQTLPFGNTMMERSGILVIDDDMTFADGQPIRAASSALDDHLRRSFSHTTTYPTIALVPVQPSVTAVPSLAPSWGYRPATSTTLSYAAVGQLRHGACRETSRIKVETADNVADVAICGARGVIGGGGLWGSFFGGRASRVCARGRGWRSVSLRRHRAAGRIPGL